ncbi:DNA-directed DNA polymerase [Flavobacteriaceae bacterium UJ101]|nr:DNA-directed DNA polymerase [Flavobacteriaceae bacterium UJ101]
MTQEHAKNDKRLFLLDAYALIFRGYYAFIKNPRINSKGLNTSAIMGFCNSMIEILKKENPTHIAVVFDVGKSTVRTEQYPEYKANRDETPEAIKIAVPYIQEIIKAFHIPILYKEGYEADDVIGTLAKKAEKAGFTTYMMTPDKDFGQLVSENIFMYRPAARGNGPEIWGIPEIQEKFGVERPEQVIDFLGMMGDSVDNIPGLPGVGEKTAKKYLAEFGSLENLLAHTDQLKGKAKEKIEANKELGILSKQLATIILDVPIEFDEKSLVMDPPDLEKIQEIFQELEFRRMAEQVTRHFSQKTANENLKEAFVTQSAPTKTSGKSEQMSLFGNDETSLTLPQETHTGYKTVENSHALYQYVDTKTGRKLLLEKILQQKEVCFDTETTSLNTFEAEIVGLAISFEKNTGYYITLPENQKETTSILNEFKPFFEDPTIIKIGHNLKYDLKVLANYQIEVKGNLFDTMIAHYLINPDMRHGMDILAETYLNYQPIKIETLIGKKGKNQLSMRDVEIEKQTPYACEDADITLQLKEIFEKKFTEEIKKLFYDIEMPLMRVLIQMELNGISLDSESLAKLSKELEEDSTLLEKSIYEQAGEEFNIASPKQLGPILFEKLAISKKAKKTKTGQYSTSEDVLSKLKNEHSIVANILNYRQVNKLKSTYVDALPKEVNPKTNRIHTTFGQTVAATGRLSSNNPNLQNIPIRTKRGQEVRKAFIPKDQNHILIAADYSQIELRLIAEIAQEPNMTQAFINGEDIHASTAAQIFDVDIKNVTREQRSQAKTVNFGIIYGVSAFGLSEQTGLSRSDSKKLIDAYYETYPTLKEFMAKQVEFARQQGYVETILGRRRYLKDINSSNAVVRSHAERNAINAPIQGSAADIMKLAMIEVQQHLLQENLESKLLLQVHDELVLEAPLKEKDALKSNLKNIMEQVVKTQIPLITEVEEGKNWLEAH